MRISRRRRIEIAQAAFIGSSTGQLVSVTCVDVNRLPINPAMCISSTSLKRRPICCGDGRIVSDTMSWIDK